MCIIIVKSKDKQVSQETLKNSARLNPHGLGVIFLDTNEVKYFKSKDYKVLNTERPYIAHFRYATKGKINRENTHPFICGKNTDELLMHNGTLQGYGSQNLCDSKHLAMELGTIPRHN
jgi:predicted glutamine amidotransferase